MNAMYFNAVFNVTLLSEFVQLARKPRPAPTAGNDGKKVE
jgi:hypothetical protein